MTRRSSYQVVDGRFFLTITLDPGGIRKPVADEEMHKARKRHGRRMTTARNSDIAASRGLPISVFRWNRSGVS